MTRAHSDLGTLKLALAATALMAIAATGVALYTVFRPQPAVHEIVLTDADGTVRLRLTASEKGGRIILSDDRGEARLVLSGSQGVEIVGPEKKSELNLFAAETNAGMSASIGHETVMTLSLLGSGGGLSLLGGEMHLSLSLSPGEAGLSLSRAMKERTALTVRERRAGLEMHSQENDIEVLADDSLTKVKVNETFLYPAD